MDAVIASAYVIVGGKLYSLVKPCERLQSMALIVHESRLCCRMSYRATAEELSLVLNREGPDAISHRTLDDRMTAMGNGI